MALSLFRIYLICKDAFPTSQIKNEWVVDVWREACAKTGVNLDPAIQPPVIQSELFTDGSMKLFIDTKKAIMDAVGVFYFFHASQTPDNIKRNASDAKALLSEKSFVYFEFNSGEIPRHPYQHPAIQNAIDITWFRYSLDVGIMFPEHFSPIPIPAIAFILAAIECCIDEWSDGTHNETGWDEERFKTVYQSHIMSLNDFQQRSIAQDDDAFECVRRYLLQGAREHAGVSASSRH